MKEIKTEKGYLAVICLEEICPYRRTCANHNSAGDFRSEDGIKPKLHFEQGKIICSTTHSEIDLSHEYGNYPIENHSIGCVLWDDVVETTDNYQI